MDDQLKVLEQGPFFLANVLVDSALCVACGAWVAGSVLESRFWGGRGRGTAPWCSVRLVHDLYNLAAPVAVSYPCRGSALGAVSSAVILAAFVVSAACCD